MVGGSVLSRIGQRGLLDVGDDLMDGLLAITEEYVMVNAMTARQLLGTT